MRSKFIVFFAIILIIFSTGVYTRRFDMATATSLEELEKSINEPEEEDLIDSDDLPPVVRDMAGQLMDLRDEINSTTLNTVNTALDLLFFLDIDADKAELRPSGGGVQLKIRIPTEKDKKDKEVKSIYDTFH